ncbi:MAG TPA: DUF5666 domain-containing protein [Acetobacteraceae bacterium]|nr:DUF5666 domain-containing protein [Acetobacteraceae bacterium]
MRRADPAARAGLLLVACLAACSTPGPRPVPEPARPAQEAGPATCRVGPDGGPLMAERGIGGTGQLADRGIGGTGSPPSQLADRGIGGTGIIGVITGFASVCLAGQEVALEPDTPIEIDDQPASAADLRAGQLAAVEAEGAGATLRARRIAVRSEVSGPVESVEPAGVLRVAGQRVRVSAQTWGETARQPGDWITVSGLRSGDATIEATRLEPRPPGPVLVRGTLSEVDGTPRIGSLALRPLPAELQPGQSVTAAGRYANGVLDPDTLRPDLLAENPVAYFGGSTRVFVLQGFVTAADGQLRLGQGANIPIQGPAPPIGSNLAIVRVERLDNDSLRLTSVRPLEGQAGAPFGPLGPGGSGPGFRNAPTPGGRSGEAGTMSRRSLEPAPVPDRSFGNTPPPGGLSRFGEPGGGFGRIDRSGGLRDGDGRMGVSPFGGAGPGGPAPGAPPPGGGRGR